MKGIIFEIRKAIAVKLLQVVMNILPKGEFKTIYFQFIIDNIFKL